MSDIILTDVVDRCNFSEWDLHRQFANERQATWTLEALRRRRTQNYCVRGRRVEVFAAERLRALGYTTHLTTHKAPHDVWCNAARVEVKSSCWNGQRWQCHLKHFDFDLLLWALVREPHVRTWLVIPRRVVSASNLAIWTHDPDRSSSRWRKYVDAWRLVDDVVSSVVSPYQLGLWHQHA